MQITKTDDKPLSGDLISDIRRLIETARHNVAVTVNAGLIKLDILEQTGKGRSTRYVFKKK